MTPQEGRTLLGWECRRKGVVSASQAGRPQGRVWDVCTGLLGWSQLVVEGLALGRELLLQDAIGGTHPGVVGLPLPLGQLGPKHL